MYAAFAARYLTSFFSLPFLAHVLGPAGLGDLAIATSVATVVSIWVEYGFSISALREISSAEPDDRGGILVGVTVGKLGLFALAWLGFVVLKLCLPSISRFPADLGLVILLGGVGGFNLGWFFLGTGRAMVSAAMDAVAALMWFVPALFLVRSPSDVNLVITCQLLAQAALVAIGYGAALANLNHIHINWSQVVGQLKSGLPLFIKKIAQAVHTMVIVLILGAMAGQAQVGYFNAADRFAGMIVASFYPAAQVIMPHLFNRMATDGQDSIFRASRYMSAVLLIISIVIAVIIGVSASIIIAIFTGPQFSDSVFVLQILALSFPIIAINQGLGLYLMLPLRLDVSFVTGILISECVALCLAYVWAPTSGAVAIAFCRVIENAIAAIIFVIILYRKKYLQKLLAPKPNASAAERLAQGYTKSL